MTAKSSSGGSSRAAFLGAGNMASALVRGLLRPVGDRRWAITISDIDPARTAGYREVRAVNVAQDNRHALQDAEVAVLGVKPAAAAGVLQEVRDLLPADGPLLLSIAAGRTTAWLEACLLPGARVIRAMPNLPAAVGAGATALSPGQSANAADMDTAEDFFSHAGCVVRVDEGAMDAVTALSGSGPAYVFYLLEILAAAGKDMGLEPETAQRLALQTVKGAALLAEASHEPPALLRAKVTSPGGTTAAALQVLEEAKMRELWTAALQAARQRARDLAGAPS